MLFCFHCVSLVYGGLLCRSQRNEFHTLTYAGRHRSREVFLQAFSLDPLLYLRKSLLNALYSLLLHSPLRQCLSGYNVPTSAGNTPLPISSFHTLPSPHLMVNSPPFHRVSLRVNHCLTVCHSECTDPATPSACLSLAGSIWLIHASRSSNDTPRWHGAHWS
jgi:hypothetical protein